MLIERAAIFLQNENIEQTSMNWDEYVDSSITKLVQKQQKSSPNANNLS